jgi:hypothetical protein
MASLLSTFCHSAAQRGICCFCHFPPATRNPPLFVIPQRSEESAVFSFPTCNPESAAFCHSERSEESASAFAVVVCSTGSS